MHKYLILFVLGLSLSACQGSAPKADSAFVDSLSRAPAGAELDRIFCLDNGQYKKCGPEAVVGDETGKKVCFEGDAEAMANAIRTRWKDGKGIPPKGLKEVSVKDHGHIVNIRTKHARRVLNFPLSACPKKLAAE